MSWIKTGDYQQEWIQAAKRRISGLIKKMERYDMSLKTALASAYLQGIADAVELRLDHRSRND